MAASQADSPAAEGQETPESVASCIGKVLLVSPHLDDAVLGCADLLARHSGAAGPTTVTVFPRASYERRCRHAEDGRLP